MKLNWIPYGKEKTILFLIVCVYSYGCKVKNKVEFPKYAEYTIPSPAPAAPGEAFNPIMSGDANQKTPQCAEWTRTAGPDESLILVGEDFSDYKRTDEGKDSRFMVFSSGGFLKDASIQRVERNKAVITLDKDMPKWSMYLIWPGNKWGYGKPIAINKTDAWWIGPSYATRGSTISVYGRNLSQNNDTISSNIYIKQKRGKGTWAAVKRVNPYKVDFIVPPILSDGEYEVWTHNGHGAQYGWSGPLKLIIKDEKKWSKGVLNVKDFGAKGDGLTNDTDALMRALKAAKASPGSTLFFPEGKFIINKMLSLSDNTRWVGKGRDATIIICGSDFFSTDAMIFGRVRNIEIRDLSFDTNYNYKGSGTDFKQEAVNLDGSSDIKLHNVGIYCSGYSGLRLNNANGVIIASSKIISRKSFLGSCSNLTIDSCDFYLTNDAEMALHSWNGENISITNSTCRDYNNTDVNNGAGWGKGRFFHSAGTGGSTRHTYLESNRTYDLGVRPVDTDQNSGEQFLWEGFSAQWSGSVVSSSVSKTTLHRFSKSLAPLKFVAVITKGRGAGQSRWITSDKGSAITLESPWNVQPNKTSTIAIGHFADKIVMYKNYIDGKTETVNTEIGNASSGIQPYGGILNFIADRNTLTEVRVGIANWSTQHSTGIDPNYFNLFTNNIISRCRWGILNALLELKRTGIGLLGTTYRRNTINTAMESGIANWLSASGTPLMDNFLYEHNTFLNVSRGFSLRNKPDNNIGAQTFYKNSFSSNKKFPAIVITSNVKLRDNYYSGFSNAYAGISPGNSIEAPFHVVEISGTFKGDIRTIPFIIWNTGIARLSLKLDTDAKWLQVSDEDTFLTNERSSSIVALKADPSGLSTGIHKANLSVQSGNEIKKYTVLFNVVDSREPEKKANSD